MTLTNKTSQFFRDVAWGLGSAFGHHWAMCGSRAAWMCGDLAAFDADLIEYVASNPEDWGESSALRPETGYTRRVPIAQRGRSITSVS